MSSDEEPASEALRGEAPTTSLSDDELVVRAQGRDVAAFEELVARHEERIYRVAMRFVRDETEAREILQDTFLSAWNNLPGFKGRAQFASWLHRVAVNAALMMLRAQRRHAVVAVEDVEPEALGEAARRAGTLFNMTADWSRRPDDHFQSQELRRHIQQAVDALPESQRAVFLLRDVDGLSTEETGDALELSLPTVKTRLHRARLALREAITRYFAQG